MRHRRENICLIKKKEIHKIKFCFILKPVEHFHLHGCDSVIISIHNHHH